MYVKYFTPKGLGDKKRSSGTVPPNKGSGSTRMSCFWGMGARTSSLPERRTQHSNSKHRACSDSKKQYSSLRPRAFGVSYEVTHSSGGCLLLEAPAELALVLGSSAMPPPSRNMVTAISRLLLHASNICFPTLSVAPANKHTHAKISTACIMWGEAWTQGKRQQMHFKRWICNQTCYWYCVYKSLQISVRLYGDLCFKHN